MSIDWAQQVTAEDKQAQADAAARAQDQAERQARVDAILVTTAGGHTFQGDELSQSRMSRTLDAYPGDTEGVGVDWILADNTVATIPLSELQEALTLSVQAMNDIWVEA